MLGAFALAMLAPTKAAETTRTAASAILLSMGSPCGFVVAVQTDAPHPARQPDIGGSNQRTMGETPDFGGLTPSNPGIPVSVTKPGTPWHLGALAHEEP